MKLPPDLPCSGEQQLVCGMISAVMCTAGIPVHGISYSYDRNWQFILNKCKPLPKMPLTLLPGLPHLQKRMVGNTDCRILKSILKSILKNIEVASLVPFTEEQHTFF